MSAKAVTTVYRCPFCPATKKIVAPVGHELPESVVCGWRGCEGRANRSS